MENESESHPHAEFDVLVSKLLKTCNSIDKKIEFRKWSCLENWSGESITGPKAFVRHCVKVLLLKSFVIESFLCAICTNNTNGDLWKNPPGVPRYHYLAIWPIYNLPAGRSVQLLQQPVRYYCLLVQSRTKNIIRAN